MEARLQVWLKNQNRFKDKQDEIGTVTVKDNDSDDGSVVQDSQWWVMSCDNKGFLLDGTISSRAMKSTLTLIDSMVSLFRQLWTVQ